jgi:hypothetical protein
MARAVLRIDRALADPVLRALPGAVAGDEAAARAYARAWRALVRGLVDEQPGTPAIVAEVLDHVAVTAPFAPGGPVAALLSAAAAMMPGVPAPPVAPAPTALPDTLAYRRFARVVLQELAGAGTGLEGPMAAWELTVADVGRLFGVARQAVQQWLDAGVPPARQPKLAVLLRIASLLERELLAERIPAVVRTAAPAYGDRSILAAIADGDEDEVLASLEAAFDWSVTA